MKLSYKSWLLLGAVTAVAASPIPVPGGLPLGLLNPLSGQPASQRPPPKVPCPNGERECFEETGISEGDDQYDPLMTDKPMPGGGRRKSYWEVAKTGPNSKPKDTSPRWYPAAAANIGNEAPEYTPAMAQGDPNGTVTASLFARPLTRGQYYERDFNWIRCRGTNALHFDVGGSWPGPNAETWKKEIKRRGRATRFCNLINWHFAYVNGRGWGDGVMSASWFEPWCYPSTAIDAAIEIGRSYTDSGRHRELYIFSCQGYEDHPNYYNEAVEWEKYNKGKSPAYGDARGQGKRPE